MGRIDQLKKENEKLRKEKEKREEFAKLRKENFELKHGRKFAFAKKVGKATGRGAGLFAKKFILPIPPKQQRRRR